ncbi:hypothetical protein L484_026503 [Morus notabilis]|uniref:F-box domain-containing protein n=1 Tax=Morus notabilis TaxID=981085 RepID=W9QP31_9ROSA|nr:hypothetical protein L484_026503 [Morus notabilis]
MASLFHLPEDVLEEILMRVPPKSLKSCKGVCKLWYVTINNPKFIDEQLNFSIGNNKHPSSVTLFVTWEKNDPSLHESFSSQDTDLCLKQALSAVTIDDEDYSDSDHLPYVIEEINFPPDPETERADFPVNLLSSPSL